MTNKQTIERIQAAHQNLTMILHMAGALPTGPKAALEDALRGLSVALEGMKLNEGDPANQDTAQRKFAQEEQYQQSWTSGTDYVYTVSIQNGRSVGTTHSPGCVAVTGYTAEEYASDPYLWYRMVYKEDRKAVLEQVASARSGKETYPLEHRIFHKSGDLRWIRNAPMPRYDEQGRLVGYDGVVTDITERKKSDAALRESEEKYRGLFEASMDAIFLETMEGRIIDCNAAACKMLGYTKDELLNLNVSALVPQEVAKTLPILIKREFEDGGVMLESLNKKKDGQIIPCDISTRTITLSGEKRAIVYIRDITERKLAEQARLRQIEAETHAAVSDAAKLALEKEIAERKLAEAALRESEARLHALIDNLPFEFWAADNDLCYTMQNTTSIRNYGNVVGKCIAELDIPKPVIDEWIKQDQRALNGEILHMEYERNVNGEARVYENLVAPVIVEDAIVGIVGVGMDVGERKRAEHALEQRAKQLTLINEVGRRIAAVLDLDSLLDRAAHLIQLSFNYHHVALFTVDYQRHELIMRARAGSFAHLYHPDHRLKMEQGMVGWVSIHGEKLLANNVNLEPKYVNLYPDLVHTLSELSVPIRVGAEMVGVLDAQSPQLNAFNDNDVLVLETLADQIAIAIENAHLYKAMERELAERKQAEAALQESEKRYRTLVDTSPDAIFYVSPLMRVILCNQRAAELYGVKTPAQMVGMNALDLFGRENQPWVTEGIARLPKGWSVRSREFQLNKIDGTHFPAEVGASLVTNETGEPVGIISVVRDITQRKLLEQYLVRTERLAAMGKISAELAHEIKNPLQAIQSNIELVLDFALDPNERQEYLTLCYHELERLIELTNRLLSLAHPNKLIFQPMSVTDLVQRTLALVEKPSREAGVCITYDVPKDFPLIQVEPAQMLRVLLNLSINAIEAMPQGGDLSITAEANDDWVKLIVTNDGNIIPPEQIETIFEPFYTTKPGGTGLGLPISSNIIKEMGGTLTVENLSEPARVRFIVAFPTSNGKNEQE